MECEWREYDALLSSLSMLQLVSKVPEASGSFSVAFDWSKWVHRDQLCFGGQRGTVKTGEADFQIIAT